MKTITHISKYLMVIAGLFLVQSAISQNSWNTAAVYNGSCYYEKNEASVNSTSGEMTVEFWIKVNTTSGSYSIIGKSQFRIMTDANKIRVQAEGLTVLYSSAKLISGEWTHVAVTFSNTNNAIKIYLNGLLDNSLTTYTGSFAATNDVLVVGKSIYASILIGELDDVRIWNTVRTATEILNNYKTHIGWYTASTYDPHLIFCQTYDFDVYSPGIYFPYSGDNGTFSADILGDKPSKTVMHNNIMHFTGSSYLESNTANDPDVCLSGPITVEVWICPSSIGTKQTILDLTEAGGGGYKLDLTTTGKIAWTMGNNVGTGDIILTANKWYHIGIACEAPLGTTQRMWLYINGVRDKLFNYLKIIPSTAKLRIGVNSATADYFTGFIDEVRISNYYKSLTEIKQYMHSPMLYRDIPEAPQITVAYNFDGNLNSGTRNGKYLKNFGCNFSYATDASSPLFHLGASHKLKLDSFMIERPFIPIPSSGTAGFALDTLDIASSVAINENKMKVFLSLNHSNTNDLRVELISPQGNSVILMNQVTLKLEGFTGVLNNQTENLINGKFNDVSPIIGSANPFTVFKGKNSQGKWILKITDLVNGNTGVLNSWGLLLDGPPFVSAINDLKSENIIALFPNPSSGKFSINITNDQLRIDKLEVFNVLGVKVYQSVITNAKSEIDLTSSPKGTYFVKVSDGRKSFVQKLIIR